MAAAVFQRRRISTPVLVGCLVLLVCALAVQLTRTGIDLLVLLVAGFVLLVLERTLGDMIAESLGPAGTALVFAAVAALSVQYFLSEGGQAKASRFFAAAEARGYRPLLFASDDQAENSAGSKLSAAVARVTDVGEGGPSPAQPVRPSVSPGPGSSAAPQLPVPGGGSTSAPPSATDGTSGAAIPATDGGWFRRSAAPTGVPRVTVHPDLANQGETVTARFAVTGERNGLPSAVVFRINNRHLATVRVTAAGTAEATFVAAAPGTYRVTVEVPGAGYLGGSLTASVTVLPGRR